MVRNRRLSSQAVSLLESLAEQPGEWVHGYELFKRTGLRPGTLYPLLERLASRAALDSRWDDEPIEGRPRRRLYRLTDAGAGLLQVSRPPAELPTHRPLREATP